MNRRDLLLSTAGAALSCAIGAAPGRTQNYGRRLGIGAPLPTMPARNPWLTDSVYPTSHFNPGATDSVLHAGPAKGKKLTAGVDVKAVSNVMVSNPAVKRIGQTPLASRAALSASSKSC